MRMMNHLTFSVLLVFVSVSIDKSTAKLSLAAYYGDHMVLQQAPKQSTIWGYADHVGDDVTVLVEGNAPVVTKVFHDEGVGKNIWRTLLPAVTEPGPYNIFITSPDGNIVLRDVLFGDVWICSGQSNMQFTMSMVFNASEEIEDVTNYPNIRLFTVGMTWSRTPQFDLLQVEQYWSRPSNESVGNRDWTYFSAVCWLYAKYLQHHLRRPIGLISSTWFGTPIDAWSSPDALRMCKTTPNYTEGVKHRGSGPCVSPFCATDYPQNEPSVLWNSMMHPLKYLTIYGAIWYQGENNVNASDLYTCQFPVMIDDWRSKFNKASVNQTDITFPFGFVQLAPYRNNASIVEGYPDLRWAQTAGFGYNPNPRMPNTFMSVAMDLPDFSSPYGSIHPRDKQDVASRLVLSGLPVAYNMSAGRYQGPVISAYFIDIGYYTLQIALDNDTSAIEVRSKDGFELCCSKNNQSSCDGTDSKWIKTPLIGHGNTSVTMSYKDGCPGQWIMGIRYAWRESPCPFKTCAVYSVENQLPMSPFKTIGLIGSSDKPTAFRERRDVKYKYKGQHIY